MQFRKAPSIVAALLLIATLAFSSWLVFFSKGSSIKSPDFESASANSGAESMQSERKNFASARPRGSRRTNQNATRLPALDAPLASIIDDLEERASSGDPKAACRLAAEFSYCRQQAFWEAEDSRWLTQQKMAIDNINDSDIRNSALAAAGRELERRSARIESLREHCEGVSIPSTQLISDNWRRAALLGSYAAMKHYSSGNSFRWNEIMDSLPRLSVYRDEAETIALAVARRGDLEMRLALAAGYSAESRGSRSLLAQSLRPNQAKSLAIYESINGDLIRLEEVDTNMVGLRHEVESLLEHARQLASTDDVVNAQRIKATELNSWVALDDAMPTNRASSGSVLDASRSDCFD